MQDDFGISETLKRQLNEYPTPFILLNPLKIQENIDSIRRQLPEAKIFYSTKANSLPKVLDVMCRMHTGFEINTAEELNRLKRIPGGENATIINSSAVSSATDVRALYQAGVRQFCADRKSYLQNLSINAPDALVSIRIKVPDFGSKFSMNSRFGTTLDEASELIGVATKLGLNVNGIHFHVGSQASKPENWRAGIHIAAKLFETYPSLKVLNLGGGLPGAYQPADDAIPTILAAIKDELQLTFQKQPDLYIELGRSLVANAALTCASVIQIEEQLPVSTATLDISIFAGMIEIFESNYAIQYPIWTTGNGPLVEYQLEGPTCAGNDILTKHVTLPKLEVDFSQNTGTRVYFGKTGAYTLDYVRGSTSGFNGARIPKLLILENDKITQDG